MKIKKLFQQFTYWLGVIAVGLVVGLSLQFVQAWTEPTVAPPGGNVGAPLNTGSIYQSREGDLQIINGTSNNALLRSDILVVNTTAWMNLYGYQYSLILRPTISGGVLTNASMVEKDGNVGIGTIDPIQKLQVEEYSSDTSGELVGTGLYMVPTPSSGSTAEYKALYAETWSNSGNIAGAEFYGAHGISIYEGGSTLGKAFGTYGGVLAKSGTITDASGVSGAIETKGGNITNARILAAQSPQIFSGSITNVYGVYVHDINVGTNRYAFYYEGSDASELVVITGDGDIGIGTLDPGGYKLAVNGSAAKTTGGSWSVFSDARLKNIMGNYESGLSEIIKLNPVRYNYKDNNVLNLPTDKEHIGLVAQEVQDIIPEAIEKDGDYLMLNNDPIIWSMVNAVKELKAENDELRQRIEVLESGK